MEITRQADYYGLDVPQHEPVSQEKIAEQLKPAVPWQGPSRLAANEEIDEE